MKIVEGKKEYEVKEKDGDKFWYYKGKLHRELGPAIEYKDGGKVWFYEGKKITTSGQKIFEAEIKKIASVLNYYHVKVECTLPGIIHYKVLANSPEEAVNKIKNLPPNRVEYKLSGKRDIKVLVYDSGSTLLRFIKNLIGG